MSELTCWDYFIIGKYEEAVQVANIMFEETRDYTQFGNKCLSLLALKKYEEAIETCDLLIRETSGSRDSDFEKKGVALWCLSKKQEAIDVWRSALNTAYTDAAGGVEVPSLLYFAAVMTNNSSLRKESLKLLRRKVKSKKSINWPGSIASFLLGDISEDILLAGISTQSSLQARGLCKAYFYIAVKHYEGGNTEEVKRYIQKIHQLQRIAMLSIEFYLSDAILQ